MSGWQGCLGCWRCSPWSRLHKRQRAAKGACADGRSAAAPAPSVTPATGDEVLPFAPASVPLSAVLEGEGIGTTDDFGKFLGSLLPQSFKLLSDDRILVTDAQLIFEYTMEADRGGIRYRVPHPEATANDGPLTEVVYLTGQIGDYIVTGRLFVTGLELILDLEWWGADGKILLGEFFPRAIKLAARADGSVASDGELPVADGAYVCKCSNKSGGCSGQQCDAMGSCYTGGATCRWVRGPTL